MPIVTLTSDIGLQDYLIGAIKGQLLTKNNTFNIVDITHQLNQSNYPQAAYICSNAFKHFPEYSFHIILLNLFEQRIKHLLIAKHNNQFIVCADNGILTMIAGEKPKEIVAIPITHQQNLLQLTEVIASAITDLSNNKGTVKDGYFIQNIVEKYPLRATIGPDWMEGQILFIDHFENVIINITQTEFEEQRKGRKFKIVFKRNEIIEEISNSYANVEESEKLAFFNSAGYLEIAINQGNMAGLFGLQGFNEKMASVQNKWFYQTVRIFFE